MATAELSRAAELGSIPSRRLAETAITGGAPWVLRGDETLDRMLQGVSGRLAGLVGRMPINPFRWELPSSSLAFIGAFPLTRVGGSETTDSTAGVAGVAGAASTCHLRTRFLMRFAKSLSVVFLRISLT